MVGEGDHGFAKDNIGAHMYLYVFAVQNDLSLKIKIKLQKKGHNSIGILVTF